MDAYFVRQALPGSLPSCFFSTFSFICNLFRFIAFHNRTIGQAIWKCWHATCTKSGVRIEPNSKIVTTTQAQAPPAGSSALSFRDALAKSSTQDGENVTTYVARTRTSSPTAGRAAAKQEKPQTSATGEDTVPTPPATPKIEQPVKAAEVEASAPKGDATQTESASGTFADALGASGAAEAHGTQNSPLDQASASGAPSNTPAPDDANPSGTTQATTASSANGASLDGLGLIPQLTGEQFNLPPNQAALSPSQTATNAVSGNGSASQSARKEGSKEAGDVKPADASNSTAAAKGKPADAVAALNSTSSHSSQNGGQSSQHAQPDATQGAALNAKPADNNAAQGQTAAIHAAVHSIATGASTTGTVKNDAPAPNAAQTTSTLQDGEEATVRSSINTSKLIQTMSESEMRVGLHSAEFGTISIRTTVSQQQMLAQISLDHSDLSQAIWAHASSVQAKIGNDSGLNTLIEVNQQSASAYGDSGDSPARQQQAFVRSARGDLPAGPTEPDVGISPAALATTGNGQRLDIRA
jgi:hypothetical protein